MTRLLRYWALTFVLALFVPATQAAVFTIPAGDNAALISSISAANDSALNPGPDVIVLATNAVYSFSSPNNFFAGANALPTITSEITILGNGSTLERSISSQAAFRFLAIDGAQGGDLRLMDLTLSRGNNETGHGGGAILSAEGVLFTTNCVFIGNSADENIQEQGQMYGGAIYNSSGELIVANCVFNNNVSGFEGGAIYSRTFLRITDSVFTGNTTRYSGGALSIRSTEAEERLNILNCSFIQNSATDPSYGDGGAISAEDPIRLIGCTFSRNTTEGTIGQGGALSVYYGSAEIVNSTFSTNSTTGSGGAIFMTTEVSAYLTNVTIVGNIADSDTVSEFFTRGDGGGIYVEPFSAKPAVGSPAAALENAVNLVNCIVAGNVDLSLDDDSFPDLAVLSFGTIVSDGYNIVGITNGIELTAAAGDQFGSLEFPIDPKLGPLSNNGGPTLTHALLPGSPAFNAGNPAFMTNQVAAFDQRGAGFPRIIGGNIDVGAFELALLSQSIDFGSLSNRTYGDGPLTITAEASSELAVSFNIVSGPAALNGNELTITGVGVVTVRASQGGNESYEAAADVEQSFDVAPALLTVQPDNTTRTYGSVNPILTATISGFVYNEDNSVVSGAPDLTTDATETSPVGSYPIVASIGTLLSSNYVFGFTNGFLSITQATLVVTAENASRAYGTTNPVFTLSYSGFVNEDTVANLDSLPTVSSSASTLSPVGSYPIVVNDGSDDNYSFQFEQGTLQVTPALVTIVANNASRKAGHPNPIFTGNIFGLLNNEPVFVFYFTDADETSPPGDYPIFVQANQQSEALQNYSVTTSNGVLSVLANLPPTITWPNGDLNYTENSGSQLIDAGSTVEDPDNTNFFDATLVIDFSANGAAEDRIEIHHEGNEPGQIGVSGTNLFYGGVPMGSFSGGTDGFTPLTILLANTDFTENPALSAAALGDIATVDGVQTLLRNITYRNVSSSPALLTRTIRAVMTDGDGGTSEPVTKNIIINALPDTLTINAGNITFNPQTGLYVQRVTVGNPNGSPLSAFRVLVTQLRSDVRVQNASGKTNGIPYVQYNGVVPPQGSVTLYIEYFVPSRTSFPAPVLIGQFVKAAPPSNPTGTLQPIDRAIRLKDGSFLVEFKTQTSRIYYVQYSNDLTTWKTASPYVDGNGTQVQWIDNGAPKTESFPDTRGSRYYRVCWVAK